MSALCTPSTNMAHGVQPARNHNRATTVGFPWVVMLGAHLRVKTGVGGAQLALAVAACGLRPRACSSNGGRLGSDTQSGVVVTGKAGPSCTAGPPDPPSRAKKQSTRPIDQVVGTACLLACTVHLMLHGERLVMVQVAMVADTHPHVRALVPVAWVFVRCTIATVWSGCCA